MKPATVPATRFPEQLDLPDVWAVEPVAQLDALLDDLNTTHSTWTDRP